MYNNRILLPLFLIVQYVASSDPPVDHECGLDAGWSIPPPPQDIALKQVIAVIRHGDRTPYNGSQCWPGDKTVWNCDLAHGETPVLLSSQTQQVGRIYDKIFMSSDEVINGSCSVGQLTSIGYKQHLANGASLKAAYVQSGFLKPSLDPLEVYLRSDNVPRTILSAQSLTIGMLPPTGDTPTHVPLYTRDITYDYIEANANLCPKYDLYTDQFFESKVWSDRQSFRNNLRDEISKAIGFNIGSDEQFYDHFCDCLITHYCHNHSWPTGMTSDLYRQIVDEMIWKYYNLYKYPSVQEMARIGIGFLLKDIWKNLQNSVNGSSDHKFRLYSAHDSTIMQLLTALQIDDGLWPPYASIMLLELYLTTDKPVVRLLYNGEVKVPPFCDGQQLCDFDLYSKYLSTVTPPDDYRDFCKP